MMVDEEGQMKLWKATGAPPPKHAVSGPRSAAQDPFMKLLDGSRARIARQGARRLLLPAVGRRCTKAFNDAVTKAVTGKARGHRQGPLRETHPLVSKAAQ